MGGLGLVIVTLLAALIIVLGLGHSLRAKVQRIAVHSLPHWLVQANYVLFLLIVAPVYVRNRFPLRYRWPLVASAFVRALLVGLTLALHLIMGILTLLVAHVESLILARIDRRINGAETR